MINDPATRELMVQEDRLWTELHALVDSLSEEEATAPGYFAEGWSAKDLVAHIGSWLAEAGIALQRIRVGTYREEEFDVDEMNRQSYEAMKDVPFDLVRAQAFAARNRMLQEWGALEKVTPEAETWIRKAGPEHYREHLPRLREWVEHLSKGGAMPLQVRRDSEIWKEEGGWFTARWHFSFDRYNDPKNMGFGNLRVFNDDRLIPGAIWPMHPHRDIEGLTYVVEGLFRHEDDVGGSPGPLPAGSVQRMTLGSGAWHSEQNGSETEPMRFIQMWIMPEQKGLPPGVEQMVLTKEDRRNRLLRVIAPEGGDAVKVHGNAVVYISSMEPGLVLDHKFPDGMGGYLYVIQGEIELDGERLSTGDAAKIWDHPEITLRARDESELIMVEADLSS